MVKPRQKPEVKRRHGPKYRKVEVAVWGDDKFTSLSPAPPNGQTLWLYLLCGPRTTTFPGLVVARPAVMADDLKWTLEGFAEALREVCAEGLIDIDETSGVIVLRKALFHGPGQTRDDVRETARPESPNVVIGWSKSWAEIPDCELKASYLRLLGAFCEALGAGFVEGYRVGFRKALAKACVEAYPEAYPHPSSNQDQDQDQDQDLLPDSLSKARARDPSTPTTPRSAPPTAEQQHQLTARQELRARIWNRFTELRQEIAAELGEVAQPLDMFDPGERELALRILDAGERAEERCNHVLEVLAAEARAKETVQYLTGAMFASKPWRRLLGMTVKDAIASASPRKGPHNARAAEPPRKMKDL